MKTALGEPCEELKPLESTKDSAEDLTNEFYLTKKFVKCDRGGKQPTERPGRQPARRRSGCERFADERGDSGAA